MTYFILTTFVISLVFILISHSLAKKIGLVDKPTSRKQHKHETPLTGGLAVYSGALISLLVISPMSNNLFYLFLTSSLIFLIGLIDDFKGLPPILRISTQSAASLILIFGTNSYLYSLGNMFGLGEIILGYWGIPFTVFCVVGITNAFNMIDGKDGLLGAVTAIIVTALLWLHYINGEIYSWGQILVFSILVYLAFNLSLFGKKRKIFLGDHGSTALGHIIAWSLINLSQEVQIITPVSALWFVLLPLTDALLTFMRRYKSSSSIYMGDRLHFHHKLSDMGYSDYLILLIFCIVTMASCIVALASNIINIDESIPTIFSCS